MSEPTGLRALCDELDAAPVNPEVTQLCCALRDWSVDLLMDQRERVADLLESLVQPEPPTDKEVAALNDAECAEAEHCDLLARPEPQGPPKNCWLDDEPYLCPSPCVFDDPSEVIDNCLEARHLSEKNKPKEACKYYRTTAQPEPVVLTRPDCFNFAMDFLGGTEEVEVRNYIERLESAARAVLAQPEPQGPTDEELLASVRHFYGDQAAADMGAEDDLRTARAVFARWGRPAIEPVSGSERLPGPEDCDAEGRCWWWNSYENMWDLIDLEYRVRAEFPHSTHWLPRWALPVPGLKGE